MTEDQIKAYIEHKGVRCPYCESHDLIGDSLDECGELEARQGVECLACGKRWVDILTLTGVVPGE